MTLESTVVCVDSSEHMRNGDFLPSRLEAQREAVNLVCGTKINSNAESTVALMTIGGKSEVLVTLTSDIGKILSALHRVKPEGGLSFLTGLQIAQLALKYRQSKNHRKRIIVFVGTPIEQTENELVSFGKKLKKNNIAVDIISFGEEDANGAKLEAFIGAVNKDDGSHLLTVPSGVGVLADSLMSSPILRGGDGGGGGSGGGGGGQDWEFGVDPAMDPELAMVLRISAEEERARQAAGGTADGSATAAPTADAAPTAEAAGMDADLMAAIAMSNADPVASDSKEPSMQAANVADPTELTEEQQIALAMQMSMGGEIERDEAPIEDTATSADLAAAGDDAAFLASLAAGLGDGVDAEDPAVAAAVAAMADGAGSDAMDQDKANDGSAE